MALESLINICLVETTLSRCLRKLKYARIQMLLLIAMLMNILNVSRGQSIKKTSGKLNRIVLNDRKPQVRHVADTVTISNENQFNLSLQKLGITVTSASVFGNVYRGIENWSNTHSWDSLFRSNPNEFCEKQLMLQK